MIREPAQSLIDQAKEYLEGTVRTAVLTYIHRALHVLTNAQKFRDVPVNEIIEIADREIDPGEVAREIAEAN